MREEERKAIIFIYVLRRKDKPWPSEVEVLFVIPYEIYIYGKENLPFGLPTFGPACIGPFLLNFLFPNDYEKSDIKWIIFKEKSIELTNYVREHVLRKLLIFYFNYHMTSFHHQDQLYMFSPNLN
jgi:hypothetical protein